MRAIGKRPADRNSLRLPVVLRVHLEAPWGRGDRVELPVRGYPRLHDPCRAHVRYSVPSAPRPLLRGGLRRRIRSRRWRRQVRRRRGRRDVLSTHVRAATRREGRERCGGAVGGDRPRRPGGPWVAVGAGVHTGQAWVGAVGDDTHTEITALGDTVNTAARLASAAGAGEILVTAAAAQAADLGPGLERRALAPQGQGVADGGREPAGRWALNDPRYGRRGPEAHTRQRAGPSGSTLTGS